MTNDEYARGWQGEAQPKLADRIMHRRSGSMAIGASGKIFHYRE